MFIRNKEKNESTRNRFFGREPVFFLSFSYFLVFFYKFSLCSPKEITFKWYLFYIFELVYHFQLKAPTLLLSLLLASLQSLSVHLFKTCFHVSLFEITAVWKKGLKKMPARTEVSVSVRAATILSLKDLKDPALIPEYRIRNFDNVLLFIMCKYLLLYK